MCILEYPWTRNIFLEADWSNLYTFSDTLKRLEIQLGQVLNTIGLLYAGKAQTVTLPPAGQPPGKAVSPS